MLIVVVVMEEKIILVIIDNINIQVWEMKFYLKLVNRVICIFCLVLNF